MFSTFPKLLINNQSVKHKWFAKYGLWLPILASVRDSLYGMLLVLSLELIHNSGHKKKKKQFEHDRICSSWYPFKMFRPVSFWWFCPKMPLMGSKNWGPDGSLDRDTKIDQFDSFHIVLSHASDNILWHIWHKEPSALW